MRWPELGATPQTSRQRLKRTGESRCVMAPSSACQPTGVFARLIERRSEAFVGCRIRRGRSRGALRWHDCAHCPALDPLAQGFPF